MKTIVKPNFKDEIISTKELYLNVAQLLIENINIQVESKTPADPKCDIMTIVSIYWENSKQYHDLMVAMKKKNQDSWTVKYRIDNLHMFEFNKTLELIHV